MLLPVPPARTGGGLETPPNLFLNAVFGSMQVWNAKRHESGGEAARQRRRTRAGGPRTFSKGGQIKSLGGYRWDVASESKEEYLASGLVCDKEPHLRVRISYYRRAVQAQAHGYSRAPAACCGRIRVRSQRNRHRTAGSEMSKMPVKRAYARPMALWQTPKQAGGTGAPSARGGFRIIWALNTAARRPST